MKTSALVRAAVASTLLLAVLPSAAFAGAQVVNGIVPEPSAILIWAGIAGIAGVIYFWRRFRQR